MAKEPEVIFIKKRFMMWRKQIFIIASLVIITALFSAPAYSRERYRVQYFSGKVMVKERGNAQWKKIKRNQWIGGVAQVELTAPAELKICDTQTLRIYKTKRSGISLVRSIIKDAERAGSDVTERVIEQMQESGDRSSGKNKKERRYARSGLIKQKVMIPDSDDSAHIIATEGTKIKYEKFRVAFRDSINNKIQNKTYLEADSLKGYITTDSLGQGLLTIENQHKEGAFVRILVYHEGSPDGVDFLIPDCYYVPGQSSLQLTEYPFDCSGDFSILLFAAEDFHESEWCTTKKFSQISDIPLDSTVRTMYIRELDFRKPRRVTKSEPAAPHGATGSDTTKILK